MHEKERVQYCKQSSRLHNETSKSFLLKCENGGNENRAESKSLCCMIQRFLLVQLGVEPAHLKKNAGGSTLNQDSDGSNEAHEEERQQPKALVGNLTIKEDKKGQGQTNCPSQTSPHHDQGLTEGNTIACVLEQWEADHKDDCPDCL